MNLSALQVFRPIEPDDRAVRMIAARLARVTLIYAAIAAGGALLTFAVLVFAEFPLVRFAVGLAIGLVPLLLLVSKAARIAVVMMFGSPSYAYIALEEHDDLPSRPKKPQPALRRQVLVKLGRLSVSFLAIYGIWKFGEHFPNELFLGFLLGFVVSMLGFVVRYYIHMLRPDRTSKGEKKQRRRVR